MIGYTNSSIIWQGGGLMSSAAFTPATLPGLTYWQDPSDTATITESGGSVSQINDKSGNDYHSIQATGANQPVTGTDTINGVNALTFDGAASYMVMDSALYSLGNSPYTMFIVMKGNSTTASGSIIYGQNNSVSVAIKALFDPVETRIKAYSGLAQSDGKIGDKTNPHIFCSVNDGTHLVAGVDGAFGYKQAISNDLLTSLNLGRRTTGTEYFNGLIGEVIIYNRELSVAERNQVTNYLSDKWSIRYQTEYETLRPLTPFNRPPDYSSFTNATRTHHAVRVPQIYSREIGNIISSFNAIYMSNTGVGGLNNYTVEYLGIEDSLGNVVQDTFGGEDTFVIYNTNIDIQSDGVPASSLNMSIGDTFYIKCIISVASAGLKWPGVLPWAPYIFGDGQSIIYNPADTTLGNITSGGDFTYTGTAPTDLSVGFCPILLGTPVSLSDKSYIALGDSIGGGVGDSSTSRPTGRGFVQLAYSLDDNHVSGMNFSSGGITARYMDSQSLWKIYSKYADVGITELGTNDVGVTGTAWTDAQIQAWLLDMWNVFNNHDISQIIHSKMMVLTTSTDNWATEVNQTINNGWHSGEQAEVINTWVDTQVGVTITSVVDHPDVRGVDTYKWASPKVYNDDSVHPNTAGHEYMAVNLRAAMDAI